jgi:hypothetical protein
MCGIALGGGETFAEGHLSCLLEFLDVLEFVNLLDGLSQCDLLSG